MAGKQSKKQRKAKKKQSLPKESASTPAPTTTPPDKRIMVLKIVTRVLLTVLFFSYMFSLTLKYPLNDPDCWWHLKTGAYIIDNMEIPKEDHFAFTTPQHLSDGQIRGMRSQWLGQVAFALAEKAGGVAGVVMFRNILILLPMLFLFLWLIRNGVSHLAAMGITVLPSSLLVFQLFYSFERPQAFSFLFILLEIMLLERLRSRGAKKFDISMVLLPALMALWANMHAGFIVGNFVLGIYFFSELFMRLLRKYRRKEQTGVAPMFYAVVAASVFASFLNPNSYVMFLEYFRGLSNKFIKDISHTIAGGRSGWVEQTVLEFKPLYYFYKVLLYKWVVVYWVFTGVLFATLFIKYWIKRSIDLAELLTAVMISFFANYYARGLMFSLTVLPFFMGKTIMELRLPPLNYRKFCTAIIAVLLVLTSSFISTTYKGRVGALLRPRVAPTWITPWYPVILSQFLEETKIPGPMYNFYTWGGFLIWRLYPQYQVFIDGRALSQDISWTADAVLKTFPDWQKPLEAFDINMIVIPVVFRESGHIIPLATALVNNDEWKLVFLRSNSAVFVRNVPKNRAYIERFNMDKKLIFHEIINTENILLMGMPNNPTFHISKANALFGLGRYEEAKAIYSRFPRQSAPQLEELRKRGY